MNEYQTLKHMLLKNAENYVEHSLFHCAQRGETIAPISYSKFLSDLSKCVTIAQKLPVKRIAIVGYNSYEWIITTISLMLAGKTLILMNPDLSDQDLQHLLNYTDAECIMFSEELEDEFSYLKKDFQIGTFFTDISTIVNPKEAIATLNGLPEQDSEFLCFTSGTSKSSKGVVISSKTLVTHVNLVKTEGCFPGSQGERSFLPIPFYHIYGLTFLFHTMATGATVCITSSPRYIVKEAGLLNPHVAFIVPSMIEPLFKEKPLMPLLYEVIVGGGSCRKDQADLVRKQGVRLRNGYGSSESIALTLISSVDGDEQWLKPLSCVQCGVNKEGELWMQLPYHMDEYYKKPEDTFHALKGDTLWTGDAAVMNQDGAIKLLGRLRDTIVMENGEKIHAEDMDQTLMSMNYIKDAAVVYSSEFGMTAIIVPESENNEEDIRLQIEKYNKTTSPQFRIHHIWIRQQELPRTSTGKLKRYLLETECSRWAISEEAQ